MGSELEDDGDIVRGLGSVSLYAAYLEEQIDELLNLIAPSKPYTGGCQVSDKIKHCRKAIRALNKTGFTDLLTNLRTCRDLFNDRNELLHGRIYAGIDRPDDILKSNRPGISDGPVHFAGLANEMNNFRLAIYSPTILMLLEPSRAFLKPDDLLYECTSNLIR